MFLTQPNVEVTVFLGQNTSVPIHTPVVFIHSSDREVVQSMSFNLVTMSSTRDWVVDILMIDAKTGDIRLIDDWETRIRDQGSESSISRYKGNGSRKKNNILMDCQRRMILYLWRKSFLLCS